MAYFLDHFEPNSESILNLSKILFCSILLPFLNGISSIFSQLQSMNEVFANMSLVILLKNGEKLCKVMLFSYHICIVSQNGSNTIIMTGFSTKFAPGQGVTRTFYTYIVLNMILPETRHMTLGKREPITEWLTHRIWTI